MLQDLHAHTYYSFCGKDDPETIVRAAVDTGLTLFGITDHNYGIGGGAHDTFRPTGEEDSVYDAALRRYFDRLTRIRDRYKNEIRILRGIEVSTLRGNGTCLPGDVDISYFDYCLIEHLDMEDSITGGDPFSYADRVGCKMGIAHTDLFRFMGARGEDPLAYLTEMGQRGIFWELNVNCDSIHGYRQHEYVHRFFASEEQQELVRRSGVEISIGFDGHKTEDYLPERVLRYCRQAEALGLKFAFS